MRPLFSGTFTALITPFHEDGSVDETALTSLIEDQIAAGIEGLVILGTTGESPTVSDEERRIILSRAVAAANGRTRIIAGTGTYDTRHTIAISREAKELGADALLLVSPYYNKPTQEGLYQHFWTIAESIDLPQIVYNIAGRTGVNIETDTLVRLSAHPHIVGVKEASGSVTQMMDVLARVPSDFAVLSGDDALTFPLLCLGGHGIISVLSNVLPSAVKAMVDSLLSGDVSTARDQHFQLLPLIKGCFLETNPIPVKTALALQGKVREVFRLPLCTMQKGKRAQWQELLASHGVL